MRVLLGKALLASVGALSKEYTVTRRPKGLLPRALSAPRGQERPFLSRDVDHC